MSDAHEAQRNSRIDPLPLSSQKISPPASTFAPSDILPQDGHRPYPSRPMSDLASEKQESTQQVFGAPKSSADRSTSPPSVFDRPDGQDDGETEPTTTADSDEQASYDLKAPPPTSTSKNVEALAVRFFSADHLDYILRDPSHGIRFRRFLEVHKPQHASTLDLYVQSRKAIAAVEYANALAEHQPTESNDQPFIAATFDNAFVAKSRHTAEALLEEALPAYLTNRLVSLVTETMVKDIVGNNAPVMKELVPNLAEVYCMTDPSLDDNPIVYASEEFYNTTQYGHGYTIGRNCRFLQGPKTSTSAIKRLVEAVTAGEEITETILNYRRDGSPFINLLMVAPLYDNRGDIRYFLGCQIDVTPLIEGGKGMSSFQQLLAQNGSSGQDDQQDSMSLLGELGQLLSESEAKFVRNKMRNEEGAGRPSTQKRSSSRRILSMDSKTYVGDGVQSGLWPDLSLGHSGRLPGVYRNYLLVRPHPSLRITFTSPALRIPGLMQTKFLDRIAGPDQVKQGLTESLESGTSVTANVSWISGAGKDGKYISGTDEGKSRWIHCTPLFGSDEKVGVWMIVIVEEEEVTGQLNRHDSTTSSRSGRPVRLGEAGRKKTGNEMYADYLKEGRTSSGRSQPKTDSSREQREVDDQFRDF